MLICKAIRFPAAIIVSVVLLQLCAGISAENETAPTNPKLRAVISKLDEGLKALDAGKHAKAISHLDEMLKNLDQSLAVALLAAKGHEPFTRLFNEGGKYAKIARTVSELAAEERFEDKTDPVTVKALVDAFLRGDDASAAAYRGLKYEAGEFAVQPLLDAWAVAPNAKVRASIAIVLGDIGPRITMPLIAALSTKDAVLKQTIFDVFEQTRDWRAAPVLKAIHYDRNQPEDVRKAAGRAAHIIIKAHIPEADPAALEPAQLYTMVAEDCFAGRSKGPRAVIPLYILREKRRTFIWFRTEGKPAHAEVEPFAYNEETAILMATEALKLDPDYAPAYAVLVAAHLGEITECEGILELNSRFDNQLLTDAKRKLVAATLDNAKKTRAWIYAGGERALYDALALTVKHSRTEAALAGMTMICKAFAGGGLKHLPMNAQELNADGFYGSSLINALDGGTRAIAYMAAITLARISPESPFLHSEKVGGILVNAMEEGMSANVLIVHMRQEVRNTLRTILGKMGFSIRTAGGSVTGIEAATGFPVPDLVIIDNELDGDTGRFLIKLRGNSLTRGTPVLIVSAADEETVKRDRNRFNFKNVKGFVTDFTDADLIRSLVVNIKTVASPESERNEAIVSEAGGVVASLMPAHTIIDLSGYADKLLEIAADGGVFEMRIAAITALGNWRIEKALAPLAKIFADRAAPIEIRLTAGESLAGILVVQGGVGDEVFGRLKAALADEKPVVRAAAGRILAQALLGAEQKSMLIP